MSEFVDLTPELIAGFLDEAPNYIARLESGLLALEQQARGGGGAPAADGTPLRDAFRAAHSLKGISAALGFEGVRDLTHVMESMLDEARSGDRPLGPREFDALLGAVDQLRRQVAELALPLARGASPATAAIAPAPPPFAPPPSSAPPVIAAPTGIPPSRDATRFTPGATAPRSAAPGRAPPERLGTIRVDVERIDRIAALACELVDLKSRLACGARRLSALRVSDNLLKLVDGIAERLARGAAAEPPGPQALGRLAADFERVRAWVRRVGTAGGALRDLTAAVQSLGRVSCNLRRDLIETRQVAVGPIFQRLPRVVRDVARVAGRRAELVMRGEQVQIDRRLADDVLDVLTHLVRNAVDHGIEPPEERCRCGKPQTGQVCLRAYRRERQTRIEVRDDGRGVDVDRVRRALVERGFVDEAAAQRLSESQVLRHVFDPGLTTAAGVSQVSGRGVGLDIVLSRMNALGGSVQLDSRRGLGTTVTLCLPYAPSVVPLRALRGRGATFAAARPGVREDKSPAHGGRRGSGPAAERAD